MAWYYGTFSCGHEGRVNIIGPTKDRQWKADRKFEGLCEECYEKYLQEEREKANREAEEKAREMELPELQGSEKQVAWANTLRQELINYFTNVAEDEKSIKVLIRFYREFEDITKEEVLAVRDYIIENITDSKYYIDNRFDKIEDYIRREIKNAIKTEEDLIEEKRIADIEAESLVVPENATTSNVVEIKEKNNEIVALFEKNDTFIRIVKGLGYRWSGGWRKRITETTGTATERIAELGNKLLAEGFPVKIHDTEARKKAINADYEPEHNRWIYLRTDGKYEGWLIIRWNGKNDKLYNTARKLPGSRWDDGVAVKIEYWNELEEFAELYDFKFSTGALKAIVEYKKAFENSIVTPAEPKEVVIKDGLREILDSSMDILDDLKDD